MVTAWLESTPPLPCAKASFAPSICRSPPAPRSWVTASTMVKRPYMPGRSEEHTSELQSLMRISYAVFCLKKKHTNTIKHTHNKDTQPYINAKTIGDRHIT